MPDLFGPRLFGPEFYGRSSDWPDPIGASLESALPPWMTLTRGFAAWLRELDDVNGERWASVAVDAARFHRPSGDSAKGLLLEQSRKNWGLRSDELDDGAIWGGTATCTANNQTAPDGTANIAETLSDASAVGQALYWQNAIAGLDTKAATLSMFVKLLTGVRGSMQIPDSGSANRTKVPFTSATWKRIDGTLPVVAGTVYAQIFPAVTALLDFPAAGSEAGVGSIAAWSACMEEGLYPTSRIPSAGATATRTPDSTVITLATIGDVITAARGRIRTHVRVPFANTEEPGAIMPIGLKTTDGVRFQGSDDKMEVYNGGARVGATPALTFARGDNLSLDFHWEAGEANLRIYRGSTLLGAALGLVWTPPTLGASIALGCAPGGTAGMPGTYRNIVLG